jgi:hypothetical protein
MCISIGLQQSDCEKIDLQRVIYLKNNSCNQELPGNRDNCQYRYTVFANGKKINTIVNYTIGKTIIDKEC